MPTYLTTSARQTKNIARTLAKNILKRGSKDKAVVIALEGELGSGKTTFLQGLANGLGIKEKILSPTFVLIKRFKIYDSPKQNPEGEQVPYGADPEGEQVPYGAGKFPTGQVRFKNFYHIDCYRIERPREILELGFRKIIAEPENIVAVEWPERIKTILPKDCLIIKFKFVSKRERRIIIKLRAKS